MAMKYVTRIVCRATLPGTHSRPLPSLVLLRSFCYKSDDGTKTQPGYLRRLFSTDISCQSLEDAAEYIKKRRIKKVVVMAGAGISTPSGIPDFRTPGTGLYDNLQKFKLPYPEAIFDIDYFGINPKPFFELSKELYPSGKYRPNEAHYFIRLLYEKGLLLRMYTQNIDGLERLAGIPGDSLVEAHGTYHTATCRTCLDTYEGQHIKKAIFNDEIPHCTKSTCQGVVKPDIVFFGESLPRRFYSFMVDMPQADLLIILGTSLEVQPFAGIADATLPGVPRILLNMEALSRLLVGQRKNDVIVEGDVVDSCVKFTELLGWKDDLSKIIQETENNFKEDQSKEESDVDR